MFQKYKCKRKVSEVEFVSILTPEDGVPSNMFRVLDMRILNEIENYLSSYQNGKGSNFSNGIYLFLFGI